MKVLLAIEKYQQGKPNLPMSAADFILRQTLASTGLADITTFYYDDIAHKAGQVAMGEILILACAKVQPDLVVFNPMGWEHIDPPRNIIQAICKTMGITVVLWRGDGVGESRAGFNRSWFPFVDFMAFPDCPAYLGYSKNPQAIRIMGCCNPDCFFDRKLKRDIDISYIGSRDRPHRAEYIEFLRGHGINLVTGGGQSRTERVELVSWEECSQILCQSKIGLNFSQTIDGFSQMKGRVFETTASKTFLLEEEGIGTAEFFEDGKDLVMYSSKEDLLEKVKYYLAHDEERERIAESGYWKTTNLYNARNMWGYLFSKTGFEIPKDLASDRYFKEYYQKLEAERR